MIVKGVSGKFGFFLIELSIELPIELPIGIACCLLPIHLLDLFTWGDGGLGGVLPSARSFRPPGPSFRPPRPSFRPVLPPGPSVLPPGPSVRPVRPSARSVRPPGPSARTFPTPNLFMMLI